MPVGVFLYCHHVLKHNRLGFCLFLFFRFIPWYRKREEGNPDAWSLLYLSFPLEGAAGRFTAEQTGLPAPGRGPEGSWTPGLGLVDMVMVGAGPLSPWGSRLFVPSVSPLVWPSCPLFTHRSPVGSPCSTTVRWGLGAKPPSLEVAQITLLLVETRGLAGRTPCPRSLSGAQTADSAPSSPGSSSPSPPLCSPPPSLRLCRVPVVCLHLQSQTWAAAQQLGQGLWLLLPREPHDGRAGPPG